MIKLTELAKENNNYYYLGMNPTADCIILKYEGDVYQILLIKRNGETEYGKWALPGGFVDTNATKGEKWQLGKETAKQAAIRELNEETGLDASQLDELIQFIGIYEGNNRDPRDTKQSWSRSHAFGLILPDGFDTSKMTAGDDASDARWFNIKRLPTNLAFDHSKIIQDGLNKLLKKLTRRES